MSDIVEEPRAKNRLTGTALRVVTVLPLMMCLVFGAARSVP